MEDTLSVDERQACWCAMAAMFVDNEIDYRQVARQLVRHCPHMPMPVLKEALFNEVAPALGGAAMTAAPEVWLMWDPDEVISRVGGMLARREASLFYRLTNNIWRLECKSVARALWQSLEPELRTVQATGLDP